MDTTFIKGSKRKAKREGTIHSDAVTIELLL